MNYKEELIKIQQYIKENYNLDFELTTNYNNEFALKRRDKKNNYVAELYLGICPDYGFAPGKVLLYEEIQHGMSPYDGSNGSAVIYKGFDTIDNYLSNPYINAKKIADKQMNIFDYEGV